MGCSAALLIAGHESIASAWRGTGCEHAGKPQGLQTPGDSLGVRCDPFTFLTLIYPSPRGEGWVSAVAKGGCCAWRWCDPFTFLTLIYPSPRGEGWVSAAAKGGCCAWRWCISDESGAWCDILTTKTLPPDMKMKNDCEKNEDNICICPGCGMELDESDHLELQTGPSDALPDYGKKLKCPECGSECVCREGSPKKRHKPAQRG